jgi:exonuclease VII small subunit
MSLGLELLNKELTELKRSLEKSILSYEKGEYTLELHNTHKNNLQPKIDELERDLKILKAGIKIYKNYIIN